jgi:LysM repeat protein
MAHSSPATLIDAYRRRQQSKFPITFADLSKGLLFVFFLAAPIYVSLTGGPDFPTIVELKTNTPTFTPSITLTPSATATVTATPTNTSTLTETPDPENQCESLSPLILVVTATFESTNTLSPLPSPTETASATILPTSTVALSATPTFTETPLPTPTQILYTVHRGDTLSGIALRFGVSVEAIQSLNNLPTTIIYLGQTLQIP